MVMKLDALLLSDATATSPDGKITVYGIFDIIHCRKLPTRYPQFSVYWKIHSDEAGEISIKIHKPDGSELLKSLALPIEITEYGMSQGIMTFGGIEFPTAGEYKVYLMFDSSQEIGTTILNVRQAQTQTK